MPVHFEDHTDDFLSKNTRAFDAALERMAGDITKVAKQRVPFKTGKLFKEIHKEKLDVLKHRVVADKKYAGYQELGQRVDGTRVVKRYTTPNTGKHYMRDAVFTIMQHSLNYLRQAVRSIMK